MAEKDGMHLSLLALIVLAGCGANDPGGIPLDANGLAPDAHGCGSPGQCSSDCWCVQEGIADTIDLNAIWGFTADDVWAAGNAGNLLHWNGTEWSGVASGTTNRLGAIWGSSATDVWIVGDAGTIIRWNGTAWSSVASGTRTDLRTVWGISADDIWTGGENFLPTAEPTLLRWNGSNWTEIPSTMVPHTDWITSLWGTFVSSANRLDVWIADYSALGLGSSEISLWQSGSVLGYGLGYFISPRIGGSSTDDVWAALAPTDGNHDAWTIMHSGPLGFTLAAWFQLPGSPLGLWVNESDEAWIVGSGGNILHLSDSVWSQVESPTTRTLQGVWGSSAHDVWIVGASGTILHRVQ